MKASEVIKALQEAIERHGDCDVVSGIEMGYVFMVTGSEDDDLELVCDVPLMHGGPDLA